MCHLIRVFISAEWSFELHALSFFQLFKKVVHTLQYCPLTMAWSMQVLTLHPLRNAVCCIEGTASAILAALTTWDVISFGPEGSVMVPVDTWWSPSDSWSALAGVSDSPVWSTRSAGIPNTLQIELAQITDDTANASCLYAHMPGTADEVYICASNLFLGIRVKLETPIWEIFEEIG
jgi:hypothetical protein